MAVCLWLVYLSDHMSDRPKISDMACAWADGVHPQLKKKNQNLLWNDFTCKPQKVPNKHRSNATTQRLRAGVVLHGEYLTGWRKRQRIPFQTGVVGFVTGWHCTWPNSYAAFHLSREVVARVVLTREHDVTSWVVLLYKRYWIENQIYIA